MIFGGFLKASAAGVMWLDENLSFHLKKNLALIVVEKSWKR